MSSLDAVVVGSGPNGLAAAIVLAQAGLSVLVFEASHSIGGGTHTEPLTLPGFLHDVCSAAHPLAAAAPFFQSLPLAKHGLEWIESPSAVAHPLDDGPPAFLEKSLDATAAAFGADGRTYLDLMRPFVAHWEELARDVLAPLHWPAHPAVLARFGVAGVQSATRLAGHFERVETRALFAGIAAHAVQPLEHAGTAAPGLVLAAAGHRVGWPIARGGSTRITAALVSCFRELGGEIVTDHRVESLSQMPDARATLFDVTPRQLLDICGDRLPDRYREQLQRFRYGPGVFKVDWALAAPVPWRRPECARAATLHLGGTLEEIAAAELAVARGEHPDRPFVLLTQPSLFDDSRAPRDQQTLWGYCHVPSGSTVDMLPRIEAQIERFAPGFRDVVLARHTLNTRDLEARNANLVGGDIGEGANTLRQLLLRPAVRRNPYRTPIRGVYICSASTPPGAGVHGMCGYHAARDALREVFGAD